MKHRFAVTIIAVLIIGTILPGCSDESSRTENITVGYLPMVSSLTYFVATENGYFTDEGLNVDSKSVTKSDDMAIDLQKGDIDVAIELSITPLLRNSGLTRGNTPYKLFSVSAITEENGFDGVLVRADAPYSSLADLAGKKIAVFPGTTAANTFKEVFTQQFPGQDLPIFDATIPIPQQLTALANNDVDAVHAYEPALTIGIHKFGFKKISNSLYAIHLSPSPIGVAAINREFAENHPELAIKIIRSLDRAVKFIRNNPQQARRILETYTKAERNIADKMNIMPMSLHDEIDTANLDAYILMLKEMGESQADVRADDLIWTP